MSFNDIKGHDNITHYFKRELALKRVSSSYLFSGPDGVGKTILALTLAKAANCLTMEGDACGKCSSCLKIGNRNHPDVMLIEAKDEKDSIGIGAIRHMQERISLKPYEGRKKVYIIKHSHTMTLEAQNCLLKTLEEPPMDSIIILITPETEGLLPTVRSRCKQVKFGPLGLLLKTELAKKNGFTEEDAIFSSRLANSGIYFYEAPKDKEGPKRLIKYKNDILDEFNKKETLLDDRSFIFGGSKEELKFAVSIIESWFRDILVLKSEGGDSVLINKDRAGELKKLQSRFTFEQLDDILGDIEEVHFCISRNVGPKIAFNALKIKISERAGFLA